MTKFLIKNRDGFKKYFKKPFWLLLNLYSTLFMNCPGGRLWSLILDNIWVGIFVSLYFVKFKCLMLYLLSLVSCTFSHTWPTLNKISSKITFLHLRYSVKMRWQILFRKKTRDAKWLFYKHRMWILSCLFFWAVAIVQNDVSDCPHPYEQLILQSSSSEESSLLTKKRWFTRRLAKLLR